MAEVHAADGECTHEYVTLGGLNMQGINDFRLGKFILNVRGILKKYPTIFFLY